MVVTVEPGVYLPEWGGIRIEDDVLVTPDGCEVLTHVPKSLDSVRIEWNDRPLPRVGRGSMPVGVTIARWSRRVERIGGLQVAE